MLKKSIDNFQKKSLKERFLFVIGMLVFFAYFILGLIFILWKSMPIAMQSEYRIAFGVLLIVYSFIRFFRIFNANNE
jgi:cytochrome c biogenesis protein CcdA